MEGLNVIDRPRSRTLNGSKTTCAFDNLRYCMREVFYWAVADGHPPTHVVAGRVAIAGYEHVAGQNDPAVTYFKCIPVIVDGSIPRNEMRFMQNGQVVGQIVGIS